ncbi:MAG: trigger factor [Candidatus Gygaella obscura]|nr:trigger factor [Candidatus Gygaella obscura]
MLKTEVIKTENDVTQFSVNLSGKRITDKKDEIYKQIAKEAKIPGFRPGKAPEELIKKQYSKVAEQETIKALVPDIYDEAVKKDSLEPIDMPNISDVNLTGESLSFNVKVEVKPKIEIKKYKALNVNLEPIEVTQQDLEKAMDTVKQQKGKDLEVNDKFAKSCGYYSLADMHESLSKEIYLQKEHARVQQTRVQLIDQLKQNCSFTLPVKLVDRRFQELVENTKKELMTKYGFTEQQFSEKEAEFTERLKKDAEDDVWIYLVFEEIAKNEKITIENNFIQRVFDFLLSNANWKKVEKK